MRKTIPITEKQFNDSLVRLRKNDQALEDLSVKKTKEEARVSDRFLAETKTLEREQVDLREIVKPYLVENTGTLFEDNKKSAKIGGDTVGFSDGTPSVLTEIDDTFIARALKRLKLYDKVTALQSELRENFMVHTISIDKNQCLAHKDEAEKGLKVNVGNKERTYFAKFGKRKMIL